jgi:HTH-type transcriptional regulator/antitoxin HigA
MNIHSCTQRLRSELLIFRGFKAAIKVSNSAESEARKACRIAADTLWKNPGGLPERCHAKLVDAIPNMTIKPIRNDDDLRAAFRHLETVFQAEEGTPEADEREILVMLIEAYENQHYPIGPADPVEAIKFRMEQQGFTTRDLEAYIGSSGRVSEVLNRKRSLSLRMVKRLHDGLHIPYESLLSKVA